jgi:hypothetical protein
VIWDGSEWDIIPQDNINSGVLSITTNLPIVNNGTAQNPVLDLDIVSLAELT